MSRIENIDIGFYVTIGAVLLVIGAILLSVFSSKEKETPEISDESPAESPAESEIVADEGI